jgi:hypothetical protein
MIEIGARLLDSVSCVFNYMERASAGEWITAAGPFRMRLLVASRSIADAYLHSLLPSRGNNIDLSVAVLGASDIDLSALIPTPSEQGRAFTGEGYSASWYADQLLPVLYIFDQRRRRGVVWLAKDAVPSWELSRPACPLLQAAMFACQWMVVHAAAVGYLGRFVLLAGKGRSGKTTAALACARGGWEYAGDDFVLANCKTGELEPLYTSARLRIDMESVFADMLPIIRSVSHDNGEDRHELNLTDSFGVARIKGGKLVAFLLPRRRGSVLPKFERARPSDAFHALFLSTSMGAPGPMKILSEKLTALVAQAPVFFVDTGQHPNLIPTAFAEFIKSL